MLLFRFLGEVILISLTGVMAPGPMTAVTVEKGHASPHAGALISVGHGLVEIPLIVLIYFGLAQFFRFAWVNISIGLLGGGFLAFMAWGMFQALRRPAEPLSRQGLAGSSSLMAGILLSAGNPYFIIWWATIGAALTLRVAGYGFWGFILFALCHWLCDFIWYYLLSAAAYKGGQVMGRKFQCAVTAVSAVVLIFFGVMYVTEAGWDLIRRF